MRCSSSGKRDQLIVSCALSLCAAGFLGCSSQDPPEDDDASRAADAGCERSDAGCKDEAEARPYARWPDPLEALPHGRKQTDEVCARDGDDTVRDAFCSDAPAALGELRDLYRALAVNPETLPNGRTGVSATAHSTGLGLRSVSALNPRVFTVRLETEETELLSTAFVRGEQLVELVVRDRVDRELRFYLVGFRQDCNERAGGCHNGDLLTPAIESDWREVTLYDESDVRNTALDCAPCHQPDGPDTPKILRMQERAFPWTHWLYQGIEGGLALLGDYFAAKGDEVLAGYTATQIRDAHPVGMAQLADFHGSREPNQFDSALIEQEVRESAAARGGAQPGDNRVPGESATWRSAYERSLRGEAIAVPYHDVKVTDPDKLARYSDAYREYRAGLIEPEELPDLRDVFPDDPEQLAHMGMMTEPGADGAQVLLQACGQCHNERLDPNVSRANFRADLKGMSRTEKDLAIERLRLPDDHPLAMPPYRLRSLSDEARKRAIKVLSR